MRAYLFVSSSKKDIVNSLYVDLMHICAIYNFSHKFYKQTFCKRYELLYFFNSITLLSESIFISLFLAKYASIEYVIIYNFDLNQVHVLKNGKIIKVDYKENAEIFQTLSAMKFKSLKEIDIKQFLNLN